MHEVARNLAVGCRYVVVKAVPGGEPAGRHFLRLQSAIDHVVTRTISTRPTEPGWQVMKVERGRLPEVVWPDPSGDGSPHPEVFLAAITAEQCPESG